MESPVESFVKEKTEEQLRELHLENTQQNVELISSIILQDEQFWKLFNSLFASYIMTYAEDNRAPLIQVSS